MTGAVTTELMGAVTLIRLAHGKANVLSSAVLAELGAVLDELATDPPGAIVVTGGDRIFSAGADISEFAGPDEAAAIAERFAKTLSALAAIPRATIAAIAGLALGGGFELALACDFRFAAVSARVGQPEVLLGIVPGGGATQRLARLVGVARAKEIVLTGRQLKAEEAAALGLVDRVTPDGEVLTAALAFADQLAAGAVAAQGLAKAAIDEGWGRPIEEGIRIERDKFVAAFRTEDAAIGIRSFKESGPGSARFTGK